LFFSLEGVTTTNQTDTQKKDIANLTLEIKTQSLKIILEKINEYLNNNKGSKTTVSKGDLFYNALMEHFRSFFNLNLENLPLLQAATHLAMIGTTGQIKIFEANIEAILGDLSLHLSNYQT